MKGPAVWLCVVLATALLFDTGEGDICHRKKGVCKQSVGSTCMGVSRAKWCRYSHYMCCFPPMRGKKRKRRSAEEAQQSLLD